MIGVIGMGLVGGSLALALRDNVCGWDADSLTRQGAEKAGIDILKPREMAREADVIFVALPAEGILETVSLLLEEGASAVCDTASIKENICKEVSKRFPGAPFLGGHPLSGGTGSGWSAASEEVLFGAPWALASEDASLETLLRVSEALLPLRSPFIAVEPREHDRLLARTSHLIQMVHLAIAAEMCEWSPLAMRLSGPALKDTTRLARSSFSMWEDIIKGNRENIAGALFALQEELRQEQLVLKDVSGLRMLFRHAKMGREQLEDMRWREDFWRETSLPIAGFWRELCRRSKEGAIFWQPRQEEGLLLVQQSR